MSLAATLRERDPAVGSWLSLRDPAVAELTAELAFDFVVLDIEHTPNTMETVIEMVRAVDAADSQTEAIVRLPWNDPVVVKRVLDTGASGVMAPMIETAAEAETLVESTRYPPEGVRGVAGSRASRYGLEMEEYYRTAADEIVTIAQIETERGLENVDEIAAVEGLDALFVGPADLSANLGIYGEWDSEEFLAAVDAVIESAHAADTAVSTLAVRNADIERWVHRGFDFVMAGTDTTHVLTGSQRAKSTFEDAIEERES
ncbi:aldolase/citrate lyase family protein [Natrinema sp. 1APR25-10V2]|uniref:HpcH/HpaI aldolase family protein n=1 Tax=Natrinema sp. 1APR25-10V2 TaxID=2951081 RepID=UPI002876AECB|nr:aldolase/citrate lyase family protein [Natrinema sp. 1APR25-10V2]MDS0474414.1 aldolase/citrate lyase family protein [Natrinema sp. 1APR25-10V2]